MTGWIGDTRKIILEDFEYDYQLSETTVAVVAALRRRNERLKFIGKDPIHPDLIAAIMESKE